MHRPLGLRKPENGKYSLDSLDTTTHCFIHITGHTIFSDLKVQCNCMDITLFWILRSDFQITNKEQRRMGNVPFIFPFFPMLKEVLVSLHLLCEEGKERITKREDSSAL